MTLLIASIPNQIRDVRATEKVLERVYQAAHKGLKGDSLALAAGLLPAEYRALCQMDPNVELQAQKGKADSELVHATQLHEASLNGDAKASLAILQHVHGWTARQEVAMTVQQMNIGEILAEARGRVIDVTPTTIEGESE